MDDLWKSKNRIIKSLRLLKIHKKMYFGGVNKGILMDHFMSLRHGLQFLLQFLEYPENKDLIERIQNLVPYVKQKLQSVKYHGKGESLAVKLEHEYADLREKMKNVILKPGTNEYDDFMFLEIFTSGYDYSEISLFLCEKMKEIVTSDCKIDHITPMIKELEDIRKMLTTLLEPMFKYAKSVDWKLKTVKEKVKKTFETVTSVIDKATSFIFFIAVGKMDDKMVFCLKSSLSRLIIEEDQIMKMYLCLDTYSMRNLKSHIYMSLRLLKWSKKWYVGVEMGATLDDHFMSIKHGLNFLVEILKVSEDGVLKRRVLHLMVIVKRKLYSLPSSQIDEYRIINLEHVYGELREEMQNVVINRGTKKLFSENLEEGYFWITSDFDRTKYLLVETIEKLVTSSCKADKISPLMRELEELRKKLISLDPLFDYVRKIYRSAQNVDEEKVLAALTTFLARATCLVYLCIVGELNEDMLVSLRKYFSFLIEETEIREISLVLGIIFSYDLEADIDKSLSLLKRQEEYHIGTIDEAILKDNIVSLKHGIEFLQWLPKVYTDRVLERRIILLARNIKQTLESLTYKQGNKSLNMDVNGAYNDLREEMKIVIINQATDENDILFPDLNMISDFRGYDDFLVEKITKLISSNCKSYQVAPLKKELQDLGKVITSMKPLCLYVNRKMSYLSCEEKFLSTFLTFYHKATFLIYLSVVGKLDIEMVLSVNISKTVKETDVREMYTTILNEILYDTDYIEEELQSDYIKEHEFDNDCIERRKLYLLGNLMLLLKSNVKFLNDVNSKLYGVLIDIHTFLLGLSPSVLLRKLHLLQSSFQDILCHSIPIFCSCYLEHPEVDISAELNCVVDLINHIKSEAQELKLYYFPRVDDLGFLEFFSRYLEDLKKNQEISAKEEINTLSSEVWSLLSLAKVRNQEELNQTPWIDIVNMAYQAEYIIDLYLASNCTDLELISSLSKIIEQLKNIRTDVHALSCKSLPHQDVVTSEPQVLRTPTQLSGNDAIVILQEETSNIMEHLLMGENKVDVISIVGMAGVGKTTLALSLFNTPSMADHFDILAWCTVSQSYQNRDLLLSILDQVKASNKSHRSISDNQELADHFCRSLKNRRYLIVIDDIWDTALWNYMKSYLPDHGKGSRILITTRNKDVADQIGSKVNELHGLSEEKSWELFQKKMVKELGLSDDLLKISKAIVKNCKGLPLSIVVIAGILSDMGRAEKKWNQIAESVGSLVLSNPQGECKAILELSYNHLPNPLRSCFLYLGSFPEDREISVNRLINLWIAEGLISDTQSDSAEEVAKKYMDELISKSLVISARERSRGGVKTFRLHDLLRDFCLDKAKEKHFLTLLDQINYSQPLQDPRRLILASKMDLHFSCHSVRSMTCYCKLKTSEIEKQIGTCDMVLLKVLEVDYVNSKRFPNISNLVHLRYLLLTSWNCKIVVLPSSIRKLQNLQILVLRFDDRIKVPDFIWDMVKLRSVHISEEALLEVDSSRLQNSSFLLENLRSLSNARVSWGDSKWLSRLSGLQKLRCLFVDDDLEGQDVTEVRDDIEVDDVTEVKDNIDMDDVSEVEDITIEKDYIEVDDAKVDNEFQMLSFSDNLISLNVKHATYWKRTAISRFQFPFRLQELTLSEFYLESNDISTIGKTLPQLEVFKIYSCYGPSEYEWNVGDEDFSALKFLKLRSLNISKWFASDDSFPCLEQLWVEKCNYLDEIPLDFGSLLKLRLISVRECAPSVDHSARKIEKLQHDEQNTEMRVHIYPRKW